MVNACRLLGVAARLGLAAALATVARPDPVGIPGAGPVTTAGGPVDARDYRAFWLWAGVRPQPVLDGAERFLPAG